VPAIYHEAKGLYVLEALAAGVPVVLPRQGSFPELVEATSGGLLYDGGPDALAGAWETMLDQPDRRADFARRGVESVQQNFTETVMADRTWEIFERVAASASAGISS
jgi:glycosyltransferase involved in cell wall biosynthesis